MVDVSLMDVIKELQWDLKTVARHPRRWRRLFFFVYKQIVYENKKLRYLPNQPLRTKLSIALYITKTMDCPGTPIGKTGL
jgi:hypothetical protein